VPRRVRDIFFFALLQHCIGPSILPVRTARMRQILASGGGIDPDQFRAGGVELCHGGPV